MLVSGAVVANRFEVVALAGSGGMGAVYQARDLQTAQPVALKILAHAGDDTKAELRFLRESAILADIQHPGFPSLSQAAGPRMAPRIWRWSGWRARR